MKRSRYLFLFANVLLSSRVRADQIIGNTHPSSTAIRRRNRNGLSKEIPNDINNSIDWSYREDVSQHSQTIITEGQNDGHLRQLQTRTWKTNSNHQYSGINSDGTTAEGYWKGRLIRGLRNAGIVLAVWFIVVGSIGAVCRCYLCWENILRGNSFRYDSNIDDDDDNHQEEERSDGVDMPPVSSGYSA